MLLAFRSKFSSDIFYNVIRLLPSVKKNLFVRKPLMIIACGFNHHFHLLRNVSICYVSLQSNCNILYIQYTVLYILSIKSSDSIQPRLPPDYGDPILRSRKLLVYSENPSFWIKLQVCIIIVKLPSKIWINNLPA